MKITGPGVYDVPAHVYHADNLLSVPTLSSSIAKILVDQTPLHAWWSHPRLNPEFEKEDDKKFDFGNAMHAALLGGARLAVIPADDYRTKAAQEQRDAALARGSVPVLPHQMDRVNAACAAVKRQLRDHEAKDALTVGKPERTLIWNDGGIACRAKLDWLADQSTPEDRRNQVFYDLKTTTDANPQVWQRRLFDLGADIQAVFYARGIKAILGIANPIFRFIVVECDPPHALSVVQLSPSALDLATRKVHEAMELWATCLKTDKWPGYAPYVFHVDSPPWKTAQFEDRAATKERAREFMENTTILGAG